MEKRTYRIICILLTLSLCLPMIAQAARLSGGLQQSTAEPPAESVTEPQTESGGEEYTTLPDITGNNSGNQTETSLRTVTEKLMLTEENTPAETAKTEQTSAEQTTYIPIEINNNEETVPSEVPTAAYTGESKNIIVNRSYTDKLESSGDSAIYTFEVTKRGALSVTFTHLEKMDSPGVSWKYTLFEKYSPNGDGKSYAYRILNTYDIMSDVTSSTSTLNGVYPGEFALVVSAGDIYIPQEYKIKINFDTSTLFEAEPNNTLTRYNEIYKNRSVTGVSAKGAEKDVDCFLLRLYDFTIINLKFSHMDEKLPQVGWLISLDDENGSNYYFGRSYYSDTEINSGAIGLPAGNYFITVSAHITCDVEYTLDVSEYGTEQYYEVEKNDTKETATEFVFEELTATVSGSITERSVGLDKDFYTFTAENDGVFVLSFMHENLVRDRDGWAITVIDEDGNIVFYDTSKWNEVEKVAPLMGVNAGKYYIIIDADGLLYSNVAYILRLAYVEADNWETERNNTPETADILTPGGQISGTLVNNKLDYDKDCFRFTVEKDCYASVVFSHANLQMQNVGWMITVSDENGNILKGFTSRWLDTRVSSGTIHFAPGDYIITVDTGTYFSNKKYTVNLEIEE